jgi:hypothetical protein
MTAAQRAPDDFVGRVERIEISFDAAAYLVAVIDRLGFLWKIQSGQALPGRLVDLRERLAACVCASRDATPIRAGHSDQSRADATESVRSVVDAASSQRDLVPATAATILGMKEDSVRKACREDRLGHTKTGGRYFISMADIENYRIGN